MGEKTASDLIRQFGSFEGVFLGIEDIKGKRLKENLVNFQEQAILSKKLVTIDRFVPLDEDVERLRLGEPIGDDLAEIFREQEFRGLWDRFALRHEGLTDYRLCLSEQALIDLSGLVGKEDLISIDTETTSQDPHRAKLVGISFSWEEGKGYYLPLGHLYLGAPVQVGLQRALEILRPALEDEHILKVGQNIKYDAEILRRYGVDLKGIYFDTMIASYVINPGLRQHNLDYLAQRYLNHKMISYDEVVGKGRNARSFSEVDVERACEYSCEDADITLKLMRVLDKGLKQDKNEELFYDLEMKLLPVLMDMELTGIKIDAAVF